MKRTIKHISLLTALVALFALLTVAAYADESAPSIDMSYVFTPQIQLTVYVDGTWDSTQSDVFGFGDTAAITAPEKSGDKSFSHWAADGSIISYSRELNLTMNAHTTLYAVYANAAPTAKPVAGFTSITRTDDGESISFQAIASDDTAGIVYSTKATGNNLKIGGTDVTQVAAVKYTDLLTLNDEYMPASILDANKCWMLQITPDSENEEDADTVYHARAYVTVGTETTYGDVKDVKLSELQSGIWMVANPGSDIDNALKNLTMNTVTFEPNGGVGATMTQAFISGQSATLNANTFTREGYTFSGWSTNKNGGGTTYTDGQSVTLTADTTLYAQWRTNSSDGSGRSGGSSSGTATTVTVPVTGDSGTVSVSVSVKDKDATVAPLTEKQVDSIVGTGSTASTVEIDASSLGKEITTVTIPADTVKVIEAAVSSPDKDAESLTVKLSEGSITFDAEALKTIAEQTKGDGLKVNLDDIGTEKLNTAQKTAVSDLTVETVLDAYVTSGSTRISDFKGGSATLSVPYTLKDGQTAQGIVVWYVASDGTRTQVPAIYDGKNVVFSVPHFSNYVIAYDAAKAAACPQDTTCPISAFTDAKASAWYHDGVHWAIENDVMNGVGDGKFAPNDTTTRAQVVTMLWRLDGSPAYVGMSEFSDVDNEQWYGPAIRWASAEGIVNGYDDGRFGANDAVTREQLVTILYRYAQYKKMDVSVGEDTNILSYDDAFDVHQWAMSAMQWAVGAGVVNGIGTNLEPAGDASRAQVATMLWRFCK